MVFWRRLTAASVVTAALSIGPALSMDSSLEEGINAYRAGNFNRALGLLDRAKTKNSNDPTLRYYLACTYLKLGYRDSAIEEYKATIQIRPDGQTAKNSRAALQSLGVSMLSTFAKPVPKPDGTKKATKRAELKPKVIRVWCGCTNCHRLTLVMLDLMSKYRGLVDFVFVKRGEMSKQTEGIDDSLFSSGCCTAVIDNARGSMTLYPSTDPDRYLFDGFRDLESGYGTKLKPQEEHPDLVARRKELMKDIESRIKSEQEGIEQLIRRTESHTDQEIVELSSQESSRDVSDRISELREETAERVDKFKEESDKKIKLWYLRAEERLKALMNTQITQQLSIWEQTRDTKYGAALHPSLTSSDGEATRESTAYNWEGHLGRLHKHGKETYLRLTKLQPESKDYDKQRRIIEEEARIERAMIVRKQMRPKVPSIGMDSPPARSKFILTWDGCKDCDRLALFYADNRRRFGDRIEFTMINFDSQFQQEKELRGQQTLIQRLSPQEQCSFSLEGEDGFSETYKATDPTDIIIRDLTKVFKDSKKTILPVVDEPNLAKLRNHVVSETEALNADDDLSLRRQIIKFETQAKEELENMSSQRKSIGAEYDALRTQLENERDRKIQKTTDEHERRRDARYAHAKERIQLIESTAVSSGKQSKSK